MKMPIAIFLSGGIGTGIEFQGVPAVTAVTAGLAEIFDVRVYSLLPPDLGFRPTGYRLHSPPRWLAGPAIKKLRWVHLASHFLAEHTRQPHQVLFSFWGYPMGTFAVGLAKLVGKPSVIALLGAEAASVPSIDYGALRRPTTRRLVIETCARASSVVVISGQQRDTLRQHGSRAKMEVIPFGVDKAMFKPQRKNRLPPLKLLHVANLTAVKDQVTLIRGFSIIRVSIDAKLRIVGPDHMNGQLQQLTASLGLQDHVEFLGAVPYADIPAHYRWADAFVLTSLSEGQSVALAEAAMSGVLLVSTPVGCVKDLGDEAVVVVRTGDPFDLAAKVRAVAGDRAQWDRKVAFAQAWADRHDLRWTVDRLTTVVNQAGSWS
jgi:glycosyltransferase involved in cell wall biosynthesis